MAVDFAGFLNCCRRECEEGMVVISGVQKFVMVVVVLAGKESMAEICLIKGKK